MTGSTQTRRMILSGLGSLTGLAALGSFPVAARPLDEVTAAGQLRVALYGDNAPFSGMRDGSPVGIDVELARAVADALKLTLDLRIVDAGENVDGDFRLNLWRGDLADSPLADLMLHVPNDRMLAMRNEQVFLVRPYFAQELAFAWRRDAMEGFDSFADIADQSVAVEGASASDMQLLTAEGGRYRSSVRHFRSEAEAVKAFLTGETTILAGTHAGIEAALFEAKAPPDRYAVKVLTLGGLVKSRWDLGGAVRANSRDLGYAVGDALGTLIENGTLARICGTYGVTYTAPTGF